MGGNDDPSTHGNWFRVLSGKFFFIVFIFIISFLPRHSLPLRISKHQRILQGRKEQGNHHLPPMMT